MAHGNVCPDCKWEYPPHVGFLSTTDNGNILLGRYVCGLCAYRSHTPAPGSHAANCVQSAREARLELRADGEASL